MDIKGTFEDFEWPTYRRLRLFWNYAWLCHFYLFGAVWPKMGTVDGSIFIYFLEPLHRFISLSIIPLLHLPFLRLWRIHNENHPKNTTVPQGGQGMVVVRVLPPPDRPGISYRFKTLPRLLMHFRWTLGLAESFGSHRTYASTGPRVHRYYVVSMLFRFMTESSLTVFSLKECWW